MSYRFIKKISENKSIFIFFLIVSFLPFIRGCEGITIGFPTVMMESDFSNFSILGLLINLFIVFLIFFNVVKFLKSKYYHDMYFGGFISLIIYHFFWILIHLDIFYFNLDIWGWIMVPTLPLLNKFSFEIHYIWPDSFDFNLRLAYLISLIMYFLIGLGIYYLYLFVRKKYFIKK